jgi:Cation transport ATPase
MSSAKTIAFDKTGTITKGRLIVDKFLPANDFDPKLVLQYAASLETNSSHIMAEAIIDEAKKQNLELLATKDTKEFTAQGIVGSIKNHTVKVGQASFVTDDKTDSVTGSGVYVSIDDKYAGVFDLVDEIRSESKSTIEKLKDLV